MSARSERNRAAGAAPQDDVPDGDKGALLVPFARYLAMSARDPAQPARWRHSVIEAGCREMAHGERGTVALVLDEPEGMHGEVAPGLSMTVQVVAPGETTSAHRHAFWHLYMVSRGHGTAYVACDPPRERCDPPRERSGRQDAGFRQADYRIAGGDVFYVPPWASHRLHNPHTDDALVLYVIQNLPQLAGLGTLLRETADGTVDHVYRRPLSAASAANGG